MTNRGSFALARMCCVNVFGCHSYLIYGSGVVLFCDSNAGSIGKSLLRVKSCDNHDIELMELAGADPSTS